MKEGSQNRPFVVLEADFWLAGNPVILLVDGDIETARQIANQLNENVSYVGHLVGRTAFETGLFDADEPPSLPGDE